MKIVDRYVILSFIKNYIMSFMVLVGLYIVLDMVLNFDELMESRPDADSLHSSLTMVRNIADYYFHQMFLFFVHLSGIIPVVAAAFTLMRMSRFNETVALLAAGVPLLRVAAPIILCAVVVNGLLLVDQELIIPNIIPKLIRKHDQLTDQRGRFPIEAMQDANKSLLVVGAFTPPSPNAPAGMEVIDIIERDKHLQPIAHITADAAEWTGRHWTLVNGKRVELAPDRPRVEVPVETYTGTTPEEIELYRSGDYIALLSTEQINQLLKRPDSYGAIDLLRVKHTRFTQPLANVILLLLAIPCVLTREPGQLRSAAFRAVVLCGLCMGMIFLAQQLAGSVTTSDRMALYWPAIMAWLPVFIFAPVAVSLLDRVKS